MESGGFMRLSSHHNRFHRRPTQPARSACRLEPLEGRRLFAGGLDWSTFLGGSGDDSVVDVVAAPDGSGDVIVTGTSDSGDFPTAGGDRPEGASAFVARLSEDGTRLEYVSFLTGSITPRFLAIASHGSPVVVGDISGDDFATTPGAYRS